VDDLQAVIEENLRSRQSAASQAEQIVEEGVSGWQSQLRALDVVDTIRAFRSSAEEVRDQELTKALSALRTGQDAELVLKSLARNLTNKLMHTPTTRLKQAGEQGLTEHIDLAHHLFGLKKPGNDEPGP
jgi:glutamyl-tRNA reductase